MFHSFQEIECSLLDSSRRVRIALAGAHDADALSALVAAQRKGVAQGVLIGRTADTAGLLREMGEDPAQWQLTEEADDARAASLACGMVKEGMADIPMKGILPTAVFMRAILDKACGFVPDKGMLSQATVLEVPGENRLMIVSDCAVNITPSYEEKLKILKNAVALTHSLGIECPRAAVVTPVEVINPAMPSTVDAAMLSKAQQRGQITGCIVDGPLALDNAVSAAAAAHKGIVSDVAGRADILLMPDLCAGNIFTKSLTYLAHLPTAGTLCGTTSPVVMTSRTDSPEDKYHAILVAAARVV